MRTIALLLLAVPLLRADDGAAAERFYRAFWLEHAGGDRAEAEALYRKVLEEHPASPEAPRALLGLARLAAARGEAPDALVERLVRDHPGAREEIAEAQALLRAAGAFVPEERDGDSAVAKVVKGFLRNLLEGAWDEDGLTQMVDLGAAAHPMLAYALRTPDATAVKKAAEIAARQRTPESMAIVEAALRDPATPLRPTIVDALQPYGGTLTAAAISMVEALFKGGGPPLREKAIFLVGACARQNVDLRDRACAFLLRGLRDPDPGVRAAAMTPFESYLDFATDAYVAVALDRHEAGEFPALRGQIASVAHRPALAVQIERILMNDPALALPPPGLPEEAYALYGRVAARRSLANPEFLELVEGLAATSAQATSEMLRVFLEEDRPVPITRIARRNSLRRPPAAAALELRRRAIGLSARQQSAAFAIVEKLLPLRPEDLDLLLQTLSSGGGRELALPLTHDFLAGIGPEGEMRLAGHAHTPAAIACLLAGLKGEGARHRELLETVLPRFVPSARHRWIGLVAEEPAFAGPIARRLLTATEPEWGWEEAGEPDSGPSLLRSDPVQAALHSKELLPQLLQRTADPRLPIAELAIRAATLSASPETTAALISALDSPHEEIRLEALRALSDRPGAGTTEALLAHLRRARSAKERERLFTTIGIAGGEEAVPAIEAVLDEGPADAWPAWEALAKLAPRRAADRALKECGAPASRASRTFAVRALTRVADDRRVVIFGEILRNPGDPDLLVVVRAVGEQYISELSFAMLGVLRHPDRLVRETASQAVERLKFIVEARRAFEPK